MAIILLFSYGYLYMITIHAITFSMHAIQEPSSYTTDDKLPGDYEASCMHDHRE